MVRDLLERIGGAGVLGLRVVVEVDDTTLVHDDVLEDRPEGPRGLVDLRLGLGRESDHLGVAAALEVEDPVLAPAVLVVADQVSRGVGRQGRLAGSREAEEDRDVVCLADVRRAVHREDALERQSVVHQREDRLLDLAGVERAADQHLGARRVEDDERAAPGAVRLGVGLEPRSVEDERVRFEIAQLVLGRVDEHRPGEEGMVGVVGDDPDRDPVLRVGARKGVDDVEVGAADVRDHLLAQALEPVLRDLRVDVAPPDPVGRARLAHDELVLGRPTSVRPRVDGERTTFGDRALAALQRVVVEERRRRVPVDLTRGLDPVLAEAAALFGRGRRHGAGHPMQGRIHPRRGRVRLSVRRLLRLAVLVLAGCGSDDATRRRATRTAAPPSSSSRPREDRARRDDGTGWLAASKLAA